MSGEDVLDSTDDEYIVMTYDISAGKWATLPPYSTCYFAMTAIDNHLVLVGGKERYSDHSKVLGMWSEGSKKWTHPYPDMTTPRSSCSAVVYKQHLVVAGGEGAGGDSLSSVEVMNTDNKQWYAGRPTPIVWSKMKTAIVGDTCYFLSGTTEGCYNNKVYSVSLPALVSQLNSDSSEQIWNEMSSRMPFTRVAPLSIGGSLLAVNKIYRLPVSTLHFYQPNPGRWEKAANTPTQRYLCTSIITTDKELVVAGGSYHHSLLKSVDIAQADILTAMFD